MLEAVRLGMACGAANALQVMWDFGYCGCESTSRRNDRAGLKSIRKDVTKFQFLSGRMRVE